MRLVQTFVAFSLALPEVAFQTELIGGEIHGTAQNGRAILQLVQQLLPQLHAIRNLPVRGSSHPP